LKPPKRQRPLIAIVGINDATEVTDYLMLYGILRARGCRGRGGVGDGARIGEAVPGADRRAAGDGL